MSRKVLDNLFLLSLTGALISVAIPVINSKIWILSVLLMLIYLVLARPNVDHAYKKWSIVYFSFFLLSSLWALNPRLSLWVVLSQLVPIYIIAMSVFTFVKDESDLKRVLNVVFIVAFLMVSYLLTHMGEFIVGTRLGNSLNEEGDNPVWNSNGIGIIACFALFSGYIVYIQEKCHFLLKLLYVLIALLLVTVILLTGSRKSLLILFFPLLFFLYKKKRRNFLLIFLFSSLICYLIYELIMHVPAFYESVGRRMEDLFNILTDNTSGNEDDSRMELIQYGLGWFADSPILGYGVNCFRVLSDQTVRFAGKNFYAHNNYVELLVGVGIIGFLLYYSSYLYLFKNLRKKTDSLSIWGLSFLIILLFLGLAEVLYYEVFEQLIFCIIFCVVRINKNRLLSYGESQTC